MTQQAQEDAVLQVAYPVEFDLLKRMMAATFFEGRQPRSAEYIKGVRDLLVFKLVEKPLKNPYPVATAQADAWYAGVDEGHAVHRAHLGSRDAT